MKELDKIFYSIINVEFLIEDFKKFRNECELEIKKEMNSFEKEFKQLHDTFWSDFICSCKGNDTLECSRMERFTESNQYFKKFSDLRVKIFEIIFCCYNAKPSDKSFYKLFEDGNTNYVDMLYLLIIRREKFTKDKLKQRLNNINLDKENITFIELEIQLKERTMEESYNKGIDYINKCLWATKSERENAKAAFKEIYSELLND